MHRATEIAKIEQVLAQLDAGTVDLAEHEAHTPIAEYTSAARFEAERRILFRRFPVALAHSSEVRRPGDFVRNDDSGLPLLVCRDRSGAARVYLNVCRHRGARLVSEECGHANSFACPYHAWTYGLDGALLGIPGGEAFCHLDRAERSLVALPAVERFGVIWARLEPGSAWDDARWFAPVAADLEALGLGGLRVFAKRATLRRMNWKVALD